jgi:hypothetical protein
MPEPLPGVPPAIAAALHRLKEDLTKAAGPNLAGLILYGGLARGRFRPGKSDVNVVLLLHDISSATLEAITPALRAAWRAAGVDPLLLTPDEVPRVADAFPTKFLDIKNHHIVLTGADPFAQIEVTREQIRRRTEQELCNLLLRLRHTYVTTGTDSAALTRALARVARPLALQLLALLQVADQEVPAEDHTAQIFYRAATAFGLEREPLARLAQLREDTRPEGDLTGLCHGVLTAVARAAAIAGQTKESTP